MRYSHPVKCLVMGQYQFHGPARFVRALKEVGFEVATLCQKGDLLGKTDFADRRYFADVRDETEMVMTLHNAVTSFQPDIILPSSENNVQVLQTYRKVLDVGKLTLDDAQRQMVFDCSFPTDSEKLLFSKIDLLDRLAELGVRIPAQQELFTIGNADDFVQKHGYPVILKPSFGSGGIGIHICHDEDQLFTALGKCLKSGNRYCIQQYLGNQTAVMHYVAKDGELVAGNMTYRLRTYPGETGPTSVVRVMDNPEMLDVARKICRLLGYNGIGAPQFIVENEGVGRAWLIELNPRMGSFDHLWQRIGTDFAAALRDAWTRRPVEHKPPQLGLTVALYPQETMRDPQSPFLDGINDLPVGDEGLMAAYSQLIELKGTKPVGSTS